MVDNSSKGLAVMYGAGNIGRGFIAQLFNISEYETVFVDVNEELVNTLNNEHEYPIFITNGDEYERFAVSNVRAVNGRIISDVADVIANADVMATAVGVNILKFIAKPISEGIKLRCAMNRPELNIIICENMIDADIYLRRLISAELEGESLEYFNSKVGLVEASIGRMVPAAPEAIKAEYPLAVCVEPYGVLPVNKDGFKGKIPYVKNMLPYAPFEFFIQQKLFMHNMSHAVTAYLGSLAGYTYIWEAIGDMRIRYTVLGALIEISQAMSLHHKTEIAPLIKYSYELLNRFDNKLLGDTIARVGRDTKRKLSPNDRIAGALKLCISESIEPDNIITGLAAALRFAPADDASSSEINSYFIENGVEKTLNKYCGLDDSAIAEKVKSVKF